MWLMGPKVLVLGLGNVIMTDDGLGIYALRKLKEKGLPWEVGVLEVGTSVMDFLEEMGKTANLIAIDAIVAGHPPGTIYRIDDLMEFSRDVESVTGHDIGLLEAVSLSRQFWGYPDRVSVFGVEPKSCAVGMGLTPRVHRALSKLIKLIDSEIEMLLRHERAGIEHA